MKPKQRIDSNQRQEQILNAVSGLFAERGLSVTTKELAAAAGVSEALIYKHFKSKEEIFDKVKERCCNKVHSVAEDVFSAGGAMERLTVSMLLLPYTCVIGFEEDVLPNSEIHKLILQSLLSEGEFARQMFKEYGLWVDKLSEALTEAQDEGLLQKSHLPNETLLWMAHHFVLGMTLAGVPEKKLNVFGVSDIQLVTDCAIQSLVMLGMTMSQAKASVENTIENNNKLEFLKLFKGELS